MNPADPSSLAGAFFSHSAPVTFEINDGVPILAIHDPSNPAAYEMLAALLAAMDALSSGAPDVSAAMLDKAERVAARLLQEAVDQLDAGVARAGIRVDFSPPTRPDPD